MRIEYKEYFSQDVTCIRSFMETHPNAVIESIDDESYNGFCVCGKPMLGEEGMPDVEGVWLCDECLAEKSGKMEVAA
jgi:hypothetical protein